MRRPHLLQIWTLLLISCETIALQFMNVTWPPPHHAWAVIEKADLLDGNEPSQVRFESENTSGVFCRGRTRPSGTAGRVLFPVEGGRLEFTTAGDIKGSTTYEENSDCGVSVSFDEWDGLRLDGLPTDKPSFVARVGGPWRWDGSRRSNDSFCSAGLSAVQEVTSTTDGNLSFRVPRKKLLGSQATLAVETVCRRPGGRASKRPDDTFNVAGVLRQCIYIRFVDTSFLNDTGPCGVSTPMRSIFEEDNHAHGLGFAAWGTLLIGSGVALILCLILYLIQKRRNRCHRESDVPEYDARAARLAQMQAVVPAPDYATSTATAPGDELLPSYEMATGK